MRRTLVATLGPAAVPGMPASSPSSTPLWTTSIASEGTPCSISCCRVTSLTAMWREKRKPRAPRTQTVPRVPVTSPLRRLHSSHDQLSWTVATEGRRRAWPSAAATG